MSVYRHVLVGLDLSPEHAGRVLSRACELAEPEDIEAVHACEAVHHAHHDYSIGSFETTEQLDEAMRCEAEEFLAKACTPHGITRQRILDGSAATVIHDYAAHRCDLVVVGSHGYKAPRVFFGSHANAVLHGTPCSVLAVLTGEPTGEEAAKTEPYRRILAAVDLSDDSFKVLEEANRVAQHCKAELSLCNVRSMRTADITIDAGERLAHLADAFGLGEAYHALLGKTQYEIHTLSESLGCDLVVIGTHGRSGLQLIQGSTANAVLHGAKCDLLAVRLPE